MKSYRIKQVNDNTLLVVKGNNTEIGYCNSVRGAYEMILLEEEIYVYQGDKKSLLEQQLEIAMNALEEIKNNNNKDSVQGHAAVALDKIRMNEND
jgi:hypothetical protein